MFQGMRDVRVVDRAKTLQIATWLHRLDMAAEGDETASQTLEVAWHGKGPLLDLLLAPMMSSLTFTEVVKCVLAENRHRVESSLDDLRGTVLSSEESWMTSLRLAKRNLTSPLERGLRRR